ncbi:hypothetical protein JCM9803A_58750 [Rhodococcus erythropolis]
MIEMRRASTRMKSLRSLIAIGGAAAVAFGLAQATGTLANSTDAVNSTGAQVATGNFYPTPLPVGNISCSNNGWAGFRDATMSWPSAGPGTSYKVSVVQGTSVKGGPWYQTNTSRNFDYGTGGLGTYNIVVQVVSDTDLSILPVNRQVSSGSLRSAFYHNGAQDTTCSGNPWRLENQAWENVSTWDPTTPAPNGANPLSRMQAEAMVPNEPDALETTTTQAPSTSETVDPTTSTEPTSTTEATTTTAPSTTTPAPTTPATTSPETAPSADPKPVLTDTVESGGLTGGWTAGGNKVAVVDADGNELASGRVESGSTLHWYDGQLWIVGATEVYRIMESPQDGTWKFYKDSGQNMPDFG